jgi:tetratricopeptide (TPR) repeat protein
VLEAAAVLGRTFDYSALVAVSGADEGAVQRTLEIATAQQLVEAAEGARVAYRWRHALTQEAVADEIVLPRRQQIHSAAADALRRAGADAMTLARHLLGAGRFEEAVPVCLAAADEAEASLAFGEALELLERACRMSDDPLVRSRLLARMGRLVWMAGRPTAAEPLLDEGCAGLEAAGEKAEAAGYRLLLARCQWEESRPAEARATFEQALRELDRHGPSAELALAYLRLSGVYKFEFEHAAAVEAARKRSGGRARGRRGLRAHLGDILARIRVVRHRPCSRGAGDARRVFRGSRQSRGVPLHRPERRVQRGLYPLHTLLPGVRHGLMRSPPSRGRRSSQTMIGIATSWGRRALQAR